MEQNANLNSVASANRTHIAFFGCRNAGKSSVVNAVTGQELSVVSDVKGTTTDPVQKAMELLPFGAVVIIDTPGYDDMGALGEMRVRKTKQILNRSDMAVLVVDAAVGLRDEDEELLRLFREKELPHLVVWNKADLLSDEARKQGDAGIFVSAKTGEGIHELKEALGKLMPTDDPDHTVCGDLIDAGQTAILVCPIDKAAPKGRLIMPQQMTIRSILDAGGIASVVRESELKSALECLKEPPRLVITDSQVFRQVAEIVPDDIPLTSFSILMARYNGFLETAVRGVVALRKVKDGERILMAEGCTHHRQCGDIGTVKLPNALRKYVSAEPIFETCSGRDFPEDLSPYAAVIHCGACMITGRDVQYRMKCAVDQNVPFTNYGIALAEMNGILERSLRLFPDVHSLLA